MLTSAQSLHECANWWSIMVPIQKKCTTGEVELLSKRQVGSIMVPIQKKCTTGEVELLSKRQVGGTFSLETRKIVPPT